MSLTNEEKKHLKKQASQLKAMFNIGKEGLSDNFIDQIDKYLDVHGIVKIKVSIAENKEDLVKYAYELSEKLDADIIDKKGYTFVLFR